MTVTRLFVTATGTDVGKTLVSSLLLRAAPDFAYWKPVQTGGSTVDRDALLAEYSEARISSLATFAYDLPASPDQAAAAAGLPAPTVQGLLARIAATQNLVIEGAGGLYVPLNEFRETWLDFLQASRIPVILVAASGLGTLNHTLLSIEALANRAVPLLAVVLSGPDHPANRQSLARFHPDLPILSIPQLDSTFDDASRARLGAFIWNAIDSFQTEEQRSPQWLLQDQHHVWHPYTQHKSAPSPIPIVSAFGSYLYTDKGERLLDASASWWTNSVGHGHPRIAAAIRNQQAKLDHCGFGNATHEPGSALAARLIALAGPPFSKVFYSDNGSCAVEVALKMAAQARTNRGEMQRTKFLYFEGAYHGDTFGAMSVAESGGFHKAFAPYVFKGIESPLVTSHPSRLCPEGSLGLGRGKAHLDTLFANHAHELAAAIIEPWVQGASGMNMQNLDWLRHLAGLCRQYGVTLILDEVFTGLGRIGDVFAFQRAGIEADILCLAKGLTGGNLPLAATLCTEAVFDAFLDDDRSKALLHGHTFTGNPIACAAALQSLQIYEEEGLFANVRRLEELGMAWLGEHAVELGLIAPRCVGGILAFELSAGDYFDDTAYRLPLIARSEGLLLRTLGTTVYFITPLIISESDFNQGLDALRRSVLLFLRK